MATIAEGGVGTHISDMQAGVNNIDYVRRKCMKKHVNTVSRWVTLLISLSMLLTACSGGTSTSAPESQQATSSQQTASSEQTAPAGEASDIKLGIVAPLTGGSAQMGNFYYKGIMLAVDEINEAGGINGHKIVTVVEDDKGVAKDSVSATKKLIYDDKVDIFFGGLNSSNALANKPIAEEEKVPMFTGGTVTSIVTQDGWVFRDAVSNELQAGLWGRYVAATLNAKRVAIIHEEDSYGTELYEYSSKAMKELGIEPVAVETYKRDDSDYSGQLLKIKAQDPEVIMIAGIGVESARIAKQARQLIPGDVKLTGSDLWGNPETLSLAGDAAEGVSYFASIFAEESDSPIIQEVWENFVAKYGEKPTEHVARGYAGMMIIKEVLSKMNLDNGVDKAEFRAKVLEIKDFETTLGTTWYDDKTGELFHQIAIVQYNNGVPTFVTTVKEE